MEPQTLNQYFAAVCIGAVIFILFRFIARLYLIGDIQEKKYVESAINHSGKVQYETD